MVMRKNGNGWGEGSEVESWGSGVVCDGNTRKDEEHYRIKKRAWPLPKP